MGRWAEGSTCFLLGRELTAVALLRKYPILKAFLHHRPKHIGPSVYSSFDGFAIVAIIVEQLKQSIGHIAFDS